MQNILICEDEDAIRDFVEINLRRAGYQTFPASSGEEALEIFEKKGNQIDIALLDVMLPNIDGFEVCKRLRAQSQKIGIIMLTAKTQETDKINGLMIGADDYVSKPFSPSELIARIDALLRRLDVKADSEKNKMPHKILAGPFVLDQKSRTFHKNDVLIELTQVEYQIIELFLKNRDTALKRINILKAVWGEDYIGEEKIVDVNIRRLRMKIEDEPSNPKYIQTVWGFGYKWPNE